MAFESYPEGVKEEAFRLWAFEVNQNIAATANTLLLNDEIWEDRERPKAISLKRTLQNWVRREDWKMRAVDHFFAILPETQNATMMNIVLTANEGSSYLRDVVAGRVEPEPLRIKTAIAMLDRAGFAHVGRISPRFATQEREAILVSSIIPEEELMMLRASHGLDIVDIDGATIE